MPEPATNHARSPASNSVQVAILSGTAPIEAPNCETPLSRKARLFAVDDHALVRKGLQMLLNQQPDMQVCGDAVGVSTAKQGIDEMNPDLVTVDLGLEDGDGFELITWIHRHHPRVKILVFTSNEGSASALRALQCGAHGYVAKSDGTQELIRAIRLVLQNQRFLSSRVAQKEEPSRRVGGVS